MSGARRTRSTALRASHSAPCAIERFACGLVGAAPHPLRLRSGQASTTGCGPPLWITQVGLELSERVGRISHGMRAEVLSLLFQQESFDRLGECELLHPHPKLRGVLTCLWSEKHRSDNVSASADTWAAPNVSGAFFLPSRSAFLQPRTAHPCGYRLRMIRRLREPMSSRTLQNATHADTGRGKVGERGFEPPASRTRTTVPLCATAPLTATQNRASMRWPVRTSHDRCGSLSVSAPAVVSTNHGSLRLLTADRMVTDRTFRP